MIGMYMRFGGTLVLAFGLVLVAGMAGAENAPTKRLSLFFPIDKNNIQILPQRFEYELIDKDQFRVGNAYFDARHFRFQVKRKGGEYSFTVQWPAALLSGGEISIRDNIGKAIWIQPIDRSMIKFQRSVSENGTPVVLARLEGQAFPAKTFSALRFVPYFRTCIQKADPPTRVSLCSKDFFMRRTKKKTEILTRDSLSKETFVNINGNNVDPRGLVFLQGYSDPISLRVLLLSGATIDIDTRMKKVDFRDLSVSENGESLMIWAAGAEPTAGQKVRRMEDGSWKTVINLDRPTIYLKGDGDIPMRQEFIVQGDLRDQTLSLESLHEIPSKTYSSPLTVALKKNPQLSLVAEMDSEIEERDGETVNWRLLNLTDWTKNRRLLKVVSGERHFTAAWDVEKFPPWHFRIGAYYPVAGDLMFRRWFNNFRLGLGFEYRYIQDNYRSDDKSSSRLRVPIFWTMKPMIQFQETGWGLQVIPEQRQFGKEAASGVALGAFSYRKVPEGWYLGEWNLSELEVFTFSVGSEVKYENAFALRSHFYYRITQSQFWYWGLEYGQGRLSATAGGVSATATVGRADFTAGFSYLF